MRYFFARFDDKHNLLEILGKISTIFNKILKKIAKMHDLSIFFKKFNKPWVDFSLVWTKNANCWEILQVFDENPIEKFHFYFRIFVTKNRAFGNNTIFLQQFLQFFLGGGISPFPLATPMLSSMRKINEKKEILAKMPRVVGIACSLK